MKILLTGAAGFIGSSFARLAIQQGHFVVGYDKLTYAGRRENISEIEGTSFVFEKGCITDELNVYQLLKKYQIDTVVNMAAESHVDNSLSSPAEFLETNVHGTYKMLSAFTKYWSESAKPAHFRFLQVSTDEVFGSLGDTGKFNESSNYCPNSPYSASKAAADHFVRAWHHSYDLPVLITNCSNNYGARQFPEKLIPTIIRNALHEKPIPVYGNGKNIRDWIHVDDHSNGILLALKNGKIGESYCLGGNSERTNNQVVAEICRILDEVSPRKNNESYAGLISYVKDRAGHDWRYAIDDSKALNEISFNRKCKSFEQGLAETVRWYLENSSTHLNIK